MHWTGNYQTGNTMCIECHTTGYEKRYDAEDRPLRLALDGDQRELPVVPWRAAQAHVAWAQAQPPARAGVGGGAASAPPNLA